MNHQPSQAGEQGPCVTYRPSGAGQGYEDKIRTFLADIVPGSSRGPWEIYRGEIWIVAALALALALVQQQERAPQGSPLPEDYFLLGLHPLLVPSHPQPELHLPHWGLPLQGRLLLLLLLLVVHCCLLVPVLPRQVEVPLSQACCLPPVLVPPLEHCLVVLQPLQADGELIEDQFLAQGHFAGAKDHIFNPAQLSHASP
ncbi:hypothetical protein EYF80_009288 [Liparis tanakae]|uniref:Uncharacterized protein n=1 Tax=Liparis tanakae TaxID=230148 RepID=A0A4Z2IRD2_9TELE|nr:hypothetical protein EYF80_009288 [Liparis tanakae]